MRLLYMQPQELQQQPRPRIDLLHPQEIEYHCVRSKSQSGPPTSSVLRALARTARWHRARHEDDEYSERRILKVGDLDLHGPEFGAPPDVCGLGAGHVRWWLPPHRLPIRRLQVLPVVRPLVVVQMHLIGKNDQGISREKVCYVLR